MKGKEGNVLTLPFILRSDQLSRVAPLDSVSREEIDKVSSHYPFSIPPFYAGLIDWNNPTCPIRLQSIPSREELAGNGVSDPLDEKGIAVTPSFLKRYPGRGVFLVSSRCAMYCRFCNRKRLVGHDATVEGSREATLAYLEQDREIREVIVSGGDPFILDPAELAYVLSRLRKIQHIKILRVSTRMPVVFPERMEGHREAIRKNAPLWLVVHINHPREVTPEFVRSVTALRRDGCTVVSQTVLLRRVNDCHRILGNLFERLVETGIKPYYLFHLDDVNGASHFKVRLETGVAIMRALRGSVSGLCMPHYALDITGGVGKVPVDHAYVKNIRGKKIRAENAYGSPGTYLNDARKSACNRCGLCDDPER
jgi:lysine 2,3-aminomutase